MSEVKFWGIPTIIMIGFASLGMLYLGIDSNKNSSLQFQSTSCKLAKNPQKDECIGLIKFGVEPSLYLSDSEYRLKVDQSAINTIENNIDSAPKLAVFTLQQVEIKKLKIAKEVLDALLNISEQAQQTKS